MKFQVRVTGRSQSVELRRGAQGWECRVEGRTAAVDVVEVAAGVYSLLLDAQSFTVYVERQENGYRLRTGGADMVAAVENPRRWAGRGSTALGLAGRQEVAAPMAGKVVRVLVRENQAVEAGQGLAVVEAMKMQNEIPSPKSGVVEKVLVREGNTVEHGETLVVVA